MNSCFIFGVYFVFMLDAKYVTSWYDEMVVTSGHPNSVRGMSENRLQRALSAEEYGEQYLTKRAFVIGQAICRQVFNGPLIKSIQFLNDSFSDDKHTIPELLDLLCLKVVIAVSRLLGIEQLVA